MKYEKPAARQMGGADALVLGTKHEMPYADASPPDFVMSINAYEADE